MEVLVSAYITTANCSVSAYKDKKGKLPMITGMALKDLRTLDLVHVPTKALPISSSGNYSAGLI